MMSSDMLDFQSFGAVATTNDRGAGTYTEYFTIIALSVDIRFYVDCTIVTGAYIILAGARAASGRASQCMCACMCACTDSSKHAQLSSLN